MCLVWRVKGEWEIPKARSDNSESQVLFTASVFKKGFHGCLEEGLAAQQSSRMHDPSAATLILHSLFL